MNLRLVDKASCILIKLIVLKLEKHRSPVLRDLMYYLRELMQDYKSEVKGKTLFLFDFCLFPDLIEM